MTPQISETIAESCDTETFEFRLGPGFGITVASHTIESQEPPFEDIKDLFSDIPLRFVPYPSANDIDTAIEDEADLHEALESLEEPGSVGLDEFKKELGI